MAEEQAEENHWPGFVDALSTIVMVVTFLLILLSIAIFVMSMNIAKVIVEAVPDDTSTNMEESTIVNVESNPLEMEKKDAAEVLFRSANALSVQFDGVTLDIDEAAQANIIEFLQSQVTDSEQANLTLTAYFDGEETGYTRRRRMGYYRVMAVRNLLLEDDYAAHQLNVFVHEAPNPEQIDTVEVVRRN